MTQVSEKEHKAQMADMKTYDEQMPSVGCFQYDSVAHALCEVQKQELTPLMVESARKRGENQIEIENGVVSLSQFGSVVWNTDKFIVLVGKWAEPIQEELSELLEKEFSLPYFEFVYDEHWDLGHGWSGDMPTSR